MRLKKISRSLLIAADGVVERAEIFPIPDHPVRSAKEASRHLLYVAATPPRGGGECMPDSQFIHTFEDANYRENAASSAPRCKRP